MFFRFLEFYFFDIRELVIIVILNILGCFNSEGSRDFGFGMGFSVRLVIVGGLRVFFVVVCVVFIR